MKPPLPEALNIHSDRPIPIEDAIIDVDHDVLAYELGDTPILMLQNCITRNTPWTISLVGTVKGKQVSLTFDKAAQKYKDKWNRLIFKEDVR